MTVQVRKHKTPAPDMIRVGRVEIIVRGETVELRLWQRDGVSAEVNASQLERWAIRQMRDGVFA